MKKSLLTILCTLLSVFSWAQGTTAGDGSAEAYAVLTDNQDIISQGATGITYGKTLTFFYDTNKSTYPDAMSVGPFTIPVDRAWENLSANITSVVIEDSFANNTTLSSTAYWFYGFQNLATITGLSNLNTGNVTDMQYMFYDCSLLESVDVSGFNTANVTNMSGLFYKCHKLQTLNLSNFNTFKVTNMSWMFYGCNELTKIYAGSYWTTSSVNQSEEMFVNCTKLVGSAGTTYDESHVDASYAHIDLAPSNPGYLSDPDASSYNEAYAVLSENNTVLTFYYDTNKSTHPDAMSVGPFTQASERGWNSYMTDITTVIFDDSFANATNITSTAYWFADCSSLTEIRGIGNLNTSNVTTMLWMFCGCTSLSSIDLSGFNTVNVTDMSYMFMRTGFTSLDISSFSTYKVTQTDNMFRGCFGLTTIYVGSDWNTGAITSGADMFLNCSNLVGGAGTTYNANRIDYTFAHIDGGENNPGYFTDKNAPATAEAYAVLGEGNTMLTFYYDTNKSSHSGAMSVGPFTGYPDFQSWYSQRESITTVVFEASFANCTSLTSTAYWFFECSNLRTITGIENLKTDNVTNMHDMFHDCISLTTLDVSGFNTANVTEINGMFDGCSSLTTLDLSGFNTGNVTSMGNMFRGCSSLRTIYAGADWSTAMVGDGNTVFENCTALVGGAGTPYDANHTDYTYAHIDGGSSNPGYFTDKNAPASYVITVTSYGNGQVSVEGVPEVVEDGKKAEVAVTAGGSLEMFFFPGEGYQLDSLMVDGINVTADVVPATEQSAASYTLNNINAVHNVITFFGEKASYNEAYAVLVSEDGGNIMYATLYYDGNKASHTEGFAVVGLDEMLQNQAWMMNRSNIKTVNFDESFANCNPTSTAYWFAFCNSLTAINGLQYLNTEFVTNMEYMFHMCPALSSIDLSHFRAKSLTNMNAMFGGCSSLTSLDLSGFFTFTVTNMNYLFSGCTNLKTIYVNKYDWSTESVTAGDGVFENCTSLVGGAGTTFNDSHIDYTYARIDGGPNSTTPGYFTDKDATASVVAPEFRFEGDNLAMTTETQNASIFYKVAELPSMAEAVVDSVRNSLIVTPDGQQSTYYEHPFELKMAAVVKAIAVADNATGTIVSDTTTMVYDYEAWVNLKAAVSSGTDLYGRAQGNPNVDAQLLEQLQWALNEGDMIYNNRAQMDSFEATHFTQRINELCAQIEAQMTPGNHTVSITAGANGSILYIIGTGTAAQEGEVPAESEVVLSIADKTQLELFPRPNDNYHWENVTLNDTINFNEYVQQNNAVIVLVDQDMKWKITFAENAPVQKVATPTFSFMNDFSEELTIQSETDGAEIYYRMNGRMLEEGDTDFASGSLRWSNWNVTGAHATGEFAYGSGIGYTDDYCLSLTNTVAGTSESAQATYTFKNALTQDGYYTLRFKARSQSGRGQLVAFCQNDTLPDTRSAEATFQIGSQYQDYSMMVRIPNANSNQIVLAFGTTVDTLFIDDVLFGPVISSTEGEMLTRYTGALNLDQGVTIEAIAKKDGMEDSKPAVFDYFYRGWRYLMEIFDYGRQITHQCYGDPNVPLDEVQKMEAILADMYSHYFERRGKEHVNDSELMSIYDEMSYRLHYLEQMRNGFTVDGVSYHAVDSTQVEVIPSLEGYYRGTITVPATVNYNNINFRVTTVAQNAFRSEYLTAIFWYAGFALTATDLQSSQNPNLLLYVTEASMAPTDRDNVVINGFAKNIRLSEGGNFHCPQAFTAEAISYTREFKQQTQIGVSRGWETIALPFTVQTITHEQRGVIAPFGNTASNTHFWLRRLTSNGLQAVPTIEANTAYLISMPNSEEYVAEYNLPGRVTFSAENATVPMTEIVKDESADYVMTPCFTNAAAKQGIYVLNVGEQRSGYPEGSIFESNYRAVLPFQAYVEHKGSNPAPPYFIVGDLGGDTTGIMDNRRETITNNYWYTLDGRKLQGKPTQKGVYITNGKKVIIK